MLRLVLIQENKYTVYEGRRCIAVYELEKGSPLPGPKEIEEIRTVDIRDKA